MKTALHVQMGQRLGLTPQLLQSIRLLHLSAIELEQEVAQALEDNPLLERVDAEDDAADDDVAVDNAAPAEAEAESADDAEPDDFDDYVPGEAGTGAVGDDYDPFAQIAAGDGGGVRERILDELALDLGDAGLLRIAAWVLDHVDDAGYLECTPEALAAAAAVELGVDADALEAIRQRILRSEATGYGARDLRECLTVQLEEADAGLPGRATALALVAGHLDRLAARDDADLAVRLGVAREEIAAAVDLILTLEPKPGVAVTQAEGRAIVPDVVVRRRDGGWHVALNPHAAPRVRIDAERERLLAQAGDAAGAQRMRDLLQEARWLTRGLSMRYETLLRATRAIVARQGEFFERGDEGMRPLILREIADAVDMHESSISRITSGKYVQTPRGTYELKYFFSTPLGGAAVAGVAVRAMVKRLIDAENRAAPLADDTIVALLARRGVRVARRTVAKYRDLMHIGPAKERCRGFAAPALAASR